MLNKNLMWKVVSKEDFPDLVFEGLYENVSLKSKFNESDLAKGLVAVGYNVKKRDRVLYAPDLIVVHEDRAADFFSWLSIYATEIFPISQFSRCVSLSEWRFLEFQNKPSAQPFFYKHQLASIVVGEILSQIDGVFNLKDISLSRAYATYSLAIAQSVMIGYPEDCKNKLDKISSSRRFKSPDISVQKVFSVWEGLFYLSKSLSGFRHSNINHVMHELLISMAQLAGFQHNELLTENILSGLTSDSAERRVMTFYEMAEVALTDRKLELYPLVAIELAAAAFLVGRGTSHVFLLQPFRVRYPESYVWFGFVASVLGMDGWDEGWLRVAKGVEKLLNVDFEYMRDPATDLSWLEYEWMSGISHKDLFEDIQKISTRAISIEISTGVAYQARLVTDSSLTNGETNQKNFSLLKQNEELREIVGNFLKISRQAEYVMRQENNPKRNLEKNSRKSNNRDFFDR